MQNHECTTALDRTIGAGEKAAVDKFMSRDTAVDAFTEPAEKAVQEKV